MHEIRRKVPVRTRLSERGIAIEHWQIPAYCEDLEDLRDHAAYNYDCVKSNASHRRNVLRKKNPTYRDLDSSNRAGKLASDQRIHFNAILDRLNKGDLEGPKQFEESIRYICKMGLKLKT